MPRIVYDASGPANQQLDRVADSLELSKVKALQLAVDVLAKLSDEIGKGTEVVLRDASGKETTLWLPHVQQKAAVAQPAAAGR